MTRRGALAVPDLVARARQGDAAAVARLITLVEDASPHLREVMTALREHVGRAHVLGITGAPGVGKSTSTNALVSALRRAGKRVGVLAIDPSSPFSGGALLGDRVRMGDHALDKDVYIRSMGARGHLGGLAWSTPQAVRVLDAAGCDVVIVETVGVGQSEVEVAGPGRHHPGAAGAGDGRRHPGREGGHPGDRRRLRRQQGRPRGRRPDPSRAAHDAHHGRAPRRRVAPTRAPDRRQHGPGDRRAARRDRPARGLAGGVGRARASSYGTGAARGRGDRPRRAPRRAGAGQEARPTWTGSPVGSRQGTWTPTPRPTSCWLRAEQPAARGAGAPRCA